MDFTHYLIKTDRGRKFIIPDGELIPAIDEATFTEVMIDPKDCHRRYVKIAKPKPVINEKKTHLGVRLDFKLAYLVGLTRLRQSKNYKFKNGTFLYFRERQIKDYFIETMRSKFDDFKCWVVNHYRLESRGVDSDSCAIGFSSDKFNNLLEHLGIAERAKVTPSIIDRLSMDFREGMLLGMIDSTAFFEYTKRTKTHERHIRLIFKDWYKDFAAELFDFTDYIDIDFHLEEYEDTHRVTMSVGDISRRLDLLLKSRSDRAIEFAKKVRKTKGIQRPSTKMPINKEVLYLFTLYEFDHGRPYVNMLDAITAARNVEPNSMVTKNWKTLLFQPNMRLEVYRRPIKICLN